MNSRKGGSELKEWICAKCGIALQESKVNIAYLDAMLPVDLYKCPECDEIFVPEELALGKMAEVEKMLEDK